MSVTTIERDWFQVDTLGPIHKDLYPIVEYITSPAGVMEVTRRMPYLIGKGNVNMSLSGLRDLYEKIQAVGILDFLLPMTYKGHVATGVLGSFEDNFRVLQGAESEIACHQVIRQPQLTRTLLSGQQIIEQIAAYGIQDPNLIVKPNSFNYVYYGARYCVPDAILVRNGRVDEVFEYKTNNRLPDKKQSKASIMASFRNGLNYSMLQAVIGELCQTPANRIHLPGRESRPITLVALEDGLDQEAALRLRDAGFKVRVIGFSARGLMCLTLEYMIGKKTEDLSYYAMAITAAEAKTIKDLRTTARFI